MPLGAGIAHGSKCFAVHCVHAAGASIRKASGPWLPSGSPLLVSMPPPSPPPPGGTHNPERHSWPPGQASPSPHATPAGTVGL